MSKEIIDLLEKAKTKLAAIEIRTKARPQVKDKGDKPAWIMAKSGFECIDQALTLLKQQPTAGEFTKELRRRVTGYRKLVSPFAQDPISILSRAEEACDRLDRAEARLKELEVENGKLLDTLIAAGFIGQGTQIIGDKRYKELIVAEAINKDLIKALKRYGHHDSPCAGILDLNDDSECSCGFEAAIAKAKKEGEMKVNKRDGTTPSP